MIDITDKNCLQNRRNGDIIIAEPLLKEIERKLGEGYLVELMRLRDGTVIARSVKKKEITAAH